MDDVFVLVRRHYPFLSTFIRNSPYRFYPKPLITDL